MSAVCARAQDILLSDFEQGSYVWLPGGSWTTTGTAFGSGPAQGTLPGQGTVSGYLGNGLVNSFLGGDGSTGTLLSPAFTIQRKYIKFLIGGGNHRGQTGINLLVGGQVVRSAVGIGDRENLDWLQWTVSDLTNQTAQIQIVDSYGGGWGHLNVDQIVETDTSLTSVITASQHYLCIPVSRGLPTHLVELLVDSLVMHEFTVPLATNAPDFYMFLDLSSVLGKDLIVRIDSQLATTNQLAGFIQSNNIVATTPIYQEVLRPVYHFTARRGFINDPNGMVFYNGEYHLCYQHNPYDLVVGNQHWGHAISRDLIHWQELPEALYPDWMGQEWSGGAVVDWNNTAGFGSNAIVNFYTAAGGHSNNPRMSAGQLFTQCLAYSLDSDRSFTKYSGNPVVGNLGGDNRDPKVIWYAPAGKWVMVLWLNNNDFGFFSSADLKHWTQTSTFTFPGVIEVPELFQLPLDGNTNNLQWIFYAGAGNYYIGTFDGNAFTASSGPFSIRGGNSFAAGQIFNNIPASDGRKILIANGTGSYAGMPFEAAMDFPVELSLTTTEVGPRMYVNPVREISLLRTGTNSWASQTLVPGVDPLNGATGEAFELDTQFQPGTASQITFTLRGTQVVYDNVAHQLSCLGINQPLNAVAGVIHLHILVDRGTLEVYANDGRVYMPFSVTPLAGALPISLGVSGSGAQLNTLNIYNLSAAMSSTPALTRWSMNPTGKNSPAVFDALPTDGSQQLWTFNDLANIFPSSTNTPPPAMFANGNNGGGYSFDAGAFTNVNAALFYPQDVYGNVFNFTNTFSVELFFKSSGVQSNAGPMQLLRQGENFLRYGLTLNETAAGRLRFSLNDGQGNAPAAEIATRNYANGTWHYLLAIYNRSAGANGTLALTVANEDGSVDATNIIIGTFNGLPSGNDGNLFLGRNAYSATNNPRTFKGLIDEVQMTPDIVPDSARLGKLSSSALPCVRWGMNPTGGNAPATLDVQTSDAGQHLWTFNALTNRFPTSSNTPPINMFTNGNNGGAYSFNAAVFTNVDAALFYPQDVYGNIFAFTNSFSLELFFQSAGVQSNAGPMQLLRQGENFLRYGITLNETGAGRVRFSLNDGQGNTPAAELASRNYADGTWHYVLAKYDRSNGNGMLVLKMANEDGTVDSTNVSIGTFLGLPAGNDGNLFLGRSVYSVTNSPRTFRGLIDEVQISSGLVAESARLGRLSTNSQSSARWSMDPTGGNTPATVDALTADGSQNLWTFNGSNNIFPTSTNTPPGNMFANGNKAGAYSFNAGAFTNISGALFYPADTYGNVFNFHSSFSLELFFKTYGDQSHAGIMQLLRQGETFLRYGVTLNESGVGGARFSINDGAGHVPVANLLARNYADGTWHYLRAIYNRTGGTNGTLTLSIANEDGSVNSTNVSIQTFSGLPIGSDGNLFIGRSVYNLATNSQTFIGFIDEVQITPGVLNCGGVGWLGIPPAITTQPVSQTVTIGSNAVFTVAATGTAPLRYQWQFNGTNIAAATNSSLTLLNVQATNAGNYTARVTNSYGSITSSVAVLTVLSVTSIARWPMDPTGTNSPCVLDMITSNGSNNLWTFNDLANSYPTSTNTPPLSMFTNGNTGGAYSFDASAFTNVAGALFYPQDIYGNVFAFTNTFSVELFFKTLGDQSGRGIMEIIRQGETSFRYGITLNENAAGGVRFSIYDGAGHTPFAGLAPRNFADGTWHHLLATYNRAAGTNGTLILSVANEDGSVNRTNVGIGTFSGLPIGNDGNLFVGRNIYNLVTNSQTFVGLIDEVQITPGVVTSASSLGKFSALQSSQTQSLSPAITIYRMAKNSDGQVRMDWTGPTTAVYEVQWVPKLGEAWQTIATISSTNGMAGFVDTDPARLNGDAGFYRLLMK